MSLLSELIAQMTALIDQNREAEAQLAAARERVESAIGQAQAATEGSSNPLVADAIGQWRAGLEQIDQASVHLAAASEKVAAYIAVLLGGRAASTSGGGTGNKPPGPPPTPAPPPPPEPEPSPGGPPNSVAGVTLPLYAPDPARRPTGRPAKIEGKETKRRSLEKENESALILARAGYAIEQNPPPNPAGKEPDYLIQGEHWDCYTPSGNSPRTIYSQLHQKVSEGQADRIVLNLDRSGASTADIRARLERYPIRGLREIKIIKQGTITQFYPWESEAGPDVD